MELWTSQIKSLLVMAAVFHSAEMTITMLVGPFKKTLIINCSVSGDGDFA